MPVHFFRSYTAITSAASLTFDSRTIGVLASGASLQISLPTANASIAGYTFEIKKVDTSANGVIIKPAGSQKIDGASTKELTAAWAKSILVTDGSNWLEY